MNNLKKRKEKELMLEMLEKYNNQKIYGTEDIEHLHYDYIHSCNEEFINNDDIKIFDIVKSEVKRNGNYDMDILFDDGYDEFIEMNINNEKAVRTSLSFEMLEKSSALLIILGKANLYFYQNELNEETIIDFLDDIKIKELLNLCYDEVEEDDISERKDLAHDLLDYYFDIVKTYLENINNELIEFDKFLEEMKSENEVQ